MKKYAHYILAASLASQGAFARIDHSPAGPSGDAVAQQKLQGMLDDVSKWIGTVANQADAMIGAENKLRADIAYRKIILFSLEQGEVLVAKTGLDDKNQSQVITASIASALAVPGIVWGTQKSWQLRKIFQGKVMRGTTIAVLTAAGVAASLDLASGVVVINLGSESVTKKKDELKAEIVKLEEMLAKASGAQSN